MEPLFKNQKSVHWHGLGKNNKDELSNIIWELVLSELPYSSPLMLLFINFLLERFRLVAKWVGKLTTYREYCCKTNSTILRKLVTGGHCTSSTISQEEQERMAAFIDMLHLEARETHIAPYFTHRCHFHYHGDTARRSKDGGARKCCSLPESSTAQKQRLAKYKFENYHLKSHHCGRTQCPREYKCGTACQEQG